MQSYRTLYLILLGHPIVYHCIIISFLGIFSRARKAIGSCKLQQIFKKLLIHTYSLSLSLCVCPGSVPSIR